MSLPSNVAHTAPCLKTLAQKSQKLEPCTPNPEVPATQARLLFRMRPWMRWCAAGSSEGTDWSWATYILYGLEGVGYPKNDQT